MGFEYRIKVVEKNNGDKIYIPQIGEPKLSLGRFNYVWLGWKNLICWDHNNEIEPSKTQHNNYSSESSANELIERYKKTIQFQQEQKVKNVYFIKK